jgi:hypothetical protein
MHPQIPNHFQMSVLGRFVSAIGITVDSMNSQVAYGFQMTASSRQIGASATAMDPVRSQVLDHV